MNRRLCSRKMVEAPGRRNSGRPSLYAGGLTRALSGWVGTWFGRAAATRALPARAGGAVLVPVVDGPVPGEAIGVAGRDPPVAI